MTLAAPLANRNINPTFSHLRSFLDSKTLALNRLMTKNQSLIQFTPRQVVMALESQSARKEKKEKKNSKKGSSVVLEGSKDITLNGGDLSARGKGRDALLRTIAGFLESNGFKKTLAVFQSEAQIEENCWKSPDVNLNEFVAKLSESSDVLAAPAIGGDKLEDSEKETEKKSRKKSTKDTSIEQTVDEKSTLEKSKLVDGEQQHENKEKRKKKSSEELKPAEEERQEANQKKKDKKKKRESDPSENEETETGENVAKKKDKEGKKKKKKESEVGKETQEKEEKEKVTEKETNVETNVENEEKKVSKKRKKGEEENVENDGKKRKLEANGSAKAAPEENMEGAKSDTKEEQSTEPKSANAFKRVKVEEVKFVDERLQDNSYWAKDGADSGYGAKAQQILEQVRGRDFRHEKTKKKRGTYRGGQIDLQSHSIKFNYSDEE